MKTILITIITITLLLTTARPAANAQAKTLADTNAMLHQAALHALSIQNYNDFKKAITPLIEKMGAKKIVGLGEGTHGTSEFYKVRFWISRILIEEKGFDHLAFENDLSDGWLLNDQLSSKANLDSLMKKHMLSIWQNEETKEMLAWIKTYNTNHQHKVVITGLDYVFLRPDVEVLKQQLKGLNDASITDSIAVLNKSVTLQDDAWIALNVKDNKIDFAALEKSSYNGSLTAGRLEKAIAATKLSDSLKTNCFRALENVKEGFAPYYDDLAKVPEASRDSIMAYNTGLLLKNTDGKMIIWAHMAHLAKKGIYNNEVGGTGGYILKLFPNNYFVLGTGTANGTFTGTTDRFDNYTNPMAAYKLEVPVKNSWEAYLAASTKPAFYFSPAELNPDKFVKPLRFIGYGTDSSPATNDGTNLSDMFDAFLFIKDTHATTLLK